MIVAAVQTAPDLGAREKNLTRAISFCREAARQGAELVCFQEYFSTGFFTGQNDPQWFRLAETEQGETVATMRALARELGITLVVPFFEADPPDGGRYYNSALVISGEGKNIGKYRKQFIPSGKNHEKFYFVPGNLGTPVFRLGKLVFGIIICYDRHFFELPRILLLKGAHLALVLSGASSPKPETTWDAGLQLMAYNHGLYVLATRTASAIPQGLSYFGQARLIDPCGQTLAARADEEGYVLGDIDPEKVREVRGQQSLVRNYRLEPLQELLELLQGRIL